MYKFTLFFSIVLYSSTVQAQGWYDEVYNKTFEGIQKVSPHVIDSRADRLAFLIVEAGIEYELDPLLLVALIRRESNFLLSVEKRRQFGPSGEVGLMQVWPGGAGMLYRPPTCSPLLRTARCQIQTGSAFLAFVKNVCGGSKTAWVASYGMSRCAQEGEMDRHISVRRIKRFYEKASGRSWYSNTWLSGTKG